MFPIQNNQFKTTPVLPAAVLCFQNPQLVSNMYKIDWFWRRTLGRPRTAEENWKRMVTEQRKTEIQKLNLLNPWGVAQAQGNGGTSPDNPCGDCDKCGFTLINWALPDRSETQLRAGQTRDHNRSHVCVCEWSTQTHSSYTRNRVNGDAINLF